jgi:hypothetical protein
MSTKTQNISNINGGLADINDLLNLVTINNTIKIPKSAVSTNFASDNLNAGILIKDINSIGTGQFYKVNVDSSATDIPSLYFNNNLVIDSTKLLSELENILVDYSLETSNIIVQGGYINFYNGFGSNINTNQGSNGVGLRYSNNTVQFKNYDTNWIDLANITRQNRFSELVDVNFQINPLLNNQYITYNSASNLFVNSNLSILNDISPRLGGNLKIGNNLLQFGSTASRLVYNSAGTTNIIDNNLLVLNNNTTFTGASNYLEVNNAALGNNPFITAKSTSNLDTDIGLAINTTGEGNINLNATQGNIYANSDSLVVNGFITSSIYRTSTKVGGYNPSTSWTIPITSDTILFDFVNSSQSGTYWANVSAGISEGQKLNIIYNNKGSNVISVLANFGNNGIISGSGYSNGLEFTNIGQCSSLIYLGNGIDAWQILNTGSGVF